LARGIGFAGLVSVGNEVDLSLGEICAATLDDPAIEGYMLFLESLRHADALRAFALAAARCNKPILAYKLGRSFEARELAVSHTGALAGEDDVAQAFLADCGIARVDTLDGLIEGLPLLARVPAAAAARRPRVGVVTTTAGGATMVVDPLAVRGVGIEPPSAATLGRLAGAGLDVKPARLIDLTLTGTRYESMKATLDLLVAAPEFDLVLAVVGSSARFHPELAVKPIIDCAGSAKPIAAYLVPDAPAALTALSQAGVPNFRTPEACADAIAAALGRRMPRLLAAPAASGSTSSKPMGCSIALESRAPPRWPWMLVRRARRPCPSPIRSPSRCWQPGSPTRPTSAASCSASRIARRSPLRSARFARASRYAGPAQAWIGCWCSRWSQGWPRSSSAIGWIATSGPSSWWRPAVSLPKSIATAACAWRRSISPPRTR
jgi:hypothetical protein